MKDLAGERMRQGRDIWAERIAGVNDNMAQSHYHDFFEIYYLEKGTRTHVIYDQLYRIQNKELVLFSPYVMHYSFGERDAAFQRIVLYFRPGQICSPVLVETLKKGTGVYQLSHELSQRVEWLLHQLLAEQEQEKPYQPEYQSVLLNQLLMDLVRSTHAKHIPEQPERFAKVIRYLHENHRETITLEQLAANFYISPSYLCREFKRYTNTTVIQYLNVTRIMYAQRKLLETNQSISQIALDAGVSNITHFNRVFRQVAHLTPSAYRKQNR